jgi:hypothetical protein
MDLWEISCENGEWLELAQDNVQSQALIISDVKPSDSSTREFVHYVVFYYNKYPRPGGAGVPVASKLLVAAMLDSKTCNRLF